MNNLSIREVSTGVLSSTRLRIPCFLSRRCFFLQDNLVGGFNPSENHYSNWIVSLNRGEHKNDWNHRLAIDLWVLHTAHHQTPVASLDFPIVCPECEVPTSPVTWRHLGSKVSFCCPLTFWSSTELSHLGKRKIILKRPRKGDMLVLRRVIERTICFCLFVFLFLTFDDFDISFGMVGFIILDLLKVVGKSKKDSLKCGLMLIYHGRKSKHPLQQIQVIRDKLLRNCTSQYFHPKLDFYVL